MKDSKAKITITIDIMLFIIFLMLKLDGIINWKWIWVFSPFWIMWTLEASIALFIVLKDIKPKSRSYKPVRPCGPNLVWDAKTNTLYGPHSKEDDVND
jgi:hypothetical protein